MSEITTSFISSTALFEVPKEKIRILLCFIVMNGDTVEFDTGIMKDSVPD